MLREDDMPINLGNIVTGIANDDHAASAVMALVDRGLQWIIRLVSNGLDGDESHKVFDQLSVYYFTTLVTSRTDSDCITARLLQKTSNVKPHLADTVLSVIIQSLLK